MQESKTYGTAVIIGRWQLFHRGHATLLRAALLSAEQVIVVIGSSFKARDVRNPFNWQERQTMIEADLNADERSRVFFLPIRDYYDDERWNTSVLRGVTQLTQGQGTTTLVGFKKDHTSYYLDNFPQWVLQTVERETDLDATLLRQLFFETKDTAARSSLLAPFVSPPVLAYLETWACLDIYQELAREYLTITNYRKRWTADFYLTADAVLLANQHVLLIRRGGDIGHGQWALPGGFIERSERFYNACLRELEEETGFKATKATMRQALKDSQVFDHPARSPRGRLITYAFFFDLGNIQLPEIKGSDDAVEARWVPIEALPQWEEQMFEDHAAILDRFIGVYQ